MELDFEVLFVDEEEGFCELTYKGEKYLIEKKIGLNEICIKAGNREREKSKYVMPSRDYMSYDEYFNSQEFREGFVSDRLHSILAGAGFIYTHGYEEGFMIHYNEYKIFKNAYAAYYKDKMYHYIKTDAEGDLTIHETFENEATFWEYVESTDYMQKIMNMKEHEYQRQCVDGKYVDRQSKKDDKSYNDLWKKKIRQLTGKMVQHDRPVMERILEKPSRELKDAVWLSIREWNNWSLPYQFACVSCEKKIELRTGVGRYGQLGGFECPFCGREYFATIDDNPREHVYIYDVDNMPSSLFDSSHEPLYELVRIDKQS